MPSGIRRLGYVVATLLVLALCAAAQLRLPPTSRPRANSAPANSTGAPAPAGTPNSAGGEPEAPLPSDIPATIKVDVSLVSFPVTATDDSGRYVSTLRQEDLRLMEDNAVQKIAVFRSEQAPVSVGIVVDTSGSMVNKLPQAIDALNNF